MQLGVILIPRLHVRLPAIAWAAGILAIVLGLVALAALQTQSHNLLQLQPGDPPMPFNAAIAFAIAGAATIAALSGRPLASALLGAPVTAIGALALVGHAFGLDVGIDKLFFASAAADGGAQPDRMAPSTAFCFVLAGIALNLTWPPGAPHLKANAIISLGAATAGIGGTAIVASMAGVESSDGWASFTRMALHTAVGCVLLGIAVYFLGRQLAPAAATPTLRWRIAAFVIVGSILVLSLHLALRQHESDEIRRATAADQASFRLELKVLIEDEINALVRMADRWNVRGGVPRAEWDRDAALYIDHMYGLQSLAWIDSALLARWHQPAVTVSADADIDGISDLQAVLQESHTEGTPFVRQFPPNAQNAARFHVYVPLYNDGRFDGFLRGVIRVDMLLGPLLQEHSGDRFSYVFRAGGDVIHEQIVDPLTEMASFAHVGTFAVRDLTWDVQSWPNQSMRRAQSTRLPELTLLGGLLMVLLLAIAMKSRHDSALKSVELARSNQELARSNQELEQFAYVASHDLKAPLRGVKQLSNWIREDLGGSLSGDSARHLALLEGRVTRMDDLLNGLLAYSRIGRSTVEARTFDPRAAIRHAVDLLDLPAGFRVEYADTMPTVVGDANAFQHVLLNLVGNAIKHHDRDVGQVRIAALEREQFIEFVVADDGPGIHADYHERVFRMFQTLKSRDELEGSGMGLAIVKKVIEQEGGSIQVLSSPAVARGTMFRFTWPKDKS